MKRVARAGVAGMMLAAGAAIALARAPVGSEFTYQGRLERAGVPFEGTADIEYRLFASRTGGSQVHSPTQASNVQIHDGLVNSMLNYGPEAFAGDARFLEIAVRTPAGSGPFVTLSPRQQITAAPQAFFAARPWVTSGTRISYDAGSVSITGSDASAALTLERNWDDQNGALTLRGDRPTLRWTGGAAAGSKSWIAHVGTEGPGNLTFFCYNTNNEWGRVLSMTPEGRVAIGTPAPTTARQFEVKTGVPFPARFESSHPIASTVEFRNSSVDATWEYSVAGSSPGFALTPRSMYVWNQQPGSSPQMVITPDGLVGMSVRVPQFRLELPNVADPTGRARANQWVTYSSGRWKQNIKTIEGALDKVMQLRGVSFDWKPEHGGTHDIGFVAEEVGKVIPEIVTWEKDGKDAQGVAYDRVTALTVEAIKEQQHTIESLRHSAQELREQLESLRRELAERHEAVR